MKTIVSSATKEVIIGDGAPTVIIGERINPAGKKKMAEALKNGDMGYINKQALAQVAAGADIIDVNISLFGEDEVTLLVKTVKSLLGVIEAPLCLDSANGDALAAALDICPGKPLINSVTGEEHSLQKVLPLVQKYGTSVVGLVQDDDGLPHTVAKRVEIAHKIVARAGEMDIGPERIIIDPLAFAVGAEADSGNITIATVRQIKEELGVNMTMGLSNISFGLPDRSLINNAFAAINIAAGVTCLIAHAAKLRPAVLAADLIVAQDKHARRYIAAYRKRQQAKTA